MTSTEGPFKPLHTPSPHNTPSFIPLQETRLNWESISQSGSDQWHNAKRDAVENSFQNHRRRRSGGKSALEKETERQLRLQLRNAAGFERSISGRSNECEVRGEEHEGSVPQNVENGTNGASHQITGLPHNTKRHARRQPSRRVTPGLPRPPTFKRVLSERRDRLYPVKSCHSERGRSISNNRNLLRRTSCSSISSSPPRTPSWLPIPEMRIRKPDRSSSQPDASRRQCSRSPDANDTFDHAITADMQPFGLLPPPHFNGDGDDEDEPGDRQAGDGEGDEEDDIDPHILQEEIKTKWILNLSMHFRDHSDREKFFLTYAEEQNRWRRVTITCDYRDVPEDSLESELRSLHYQRDKSERIYRVIRDNLPSIDFFDTVTNLRLETRDDQLHVHVTEDLNEIISYPSAALLQHIRCPRYTESAVQFESHLSGFVYKVRVDGQVWVKKEIPGPGSVDEFLYEVNALTALRGTPNIIQAGGLIVDDSGELIKGLLINYAEQGSLIDILSDLKGSADLPWIRRERWAKEIVSGLSDLHESGFVQGDFTLSNIVIDEADHARIIDVNRRGCPMGWEPPELMPLIRSGQRIAMHIGVKCDIFQLGMVLWALAEEEDEPETKERPLTFSFTSPRVVSRTIPNYFKNIVRDCLSDDPRGRPSAKDLRLRFPPSVLDDHEPARGRSNRNGRGGGSGCNRIAMSEVTTSPENTEQSLPTEIADVAVNLEDVEYLRLPRPRSHAGSQISADEFSAGAVTYGYLTPSTEHSFNLHRQPLSQCGSRELSHSPFTGNRSVAASSLQYSELGEGREAASSFSGEEEANAAYVLVENQQTDASHWQQVYDAEGTRQLVNRASLAMMTQRETGFLGNETRSVPPIITASDKFDATCHVSAGSSPHTVRLASPPATINSPIKHLNSKNGTAEDGANVCFRHHEAVGPRDSYENLSKEPSSSEAKVGTKHKSKQNTTRRQTFPLAPEPPGHPSHAVSDTECTNQDTSPYDEYGGKAGLQHADDRSARTRRSSHGDKTASYPGSGDISGDQTNAKMSSGNGCVATARKRRSGMGASFHERARQLRQSYVGQNESSSLKSDPALQYLESIAARTRNPQENERRGPDAGQEEQRLKQEEKQRAQLGIVERDNIHTSGDWAIDNTFDAMPFTKLASRSYDNISRTVDEERDGSKANTFVKRASTLPISSKASRNNSSDSQPGTHPIRSFSLFRGPEESMPTRKLPFYAHAAKAAANKKNNAEPSNSESRTSKQPPMPFIPSFSTSSSTDLPTELQISQSQSPSPSSSQLTSSGSQNQMVTGVVSLSTPESTAKNTNLPLPIPKRLQQQSQTERHRRLHRASSLPVDIINTRPKGTSARSKGSSDGRNNLTGVFNGNVMARKPMQSTLLQDSESLSKPALDLNVADPDNMRLTCDVQIAELNRGRQL